MKTFHKFLKLSTYLLLSIFGCQSDTNTNPFSKADSETIDTCYLDIALPETDMDADGPKKNSKTRIDIDVYLKTKADSTDTNSHTLSINKTEISFDEFNDFVANIRVGCPENIRNRVVANLYIDKTSPYYLVDYIQKRLTSSDQFSFCFVNKKGQEIWYRNLPLYHPIWERSEIYSRPPPPPPPPKIRDDKDTIFSKNYLATLKRFGIDQKAVPNRGPDCIYYADDISPKNILEIKLNVDNQLIINDSLANLKEVLDAWHIFMEDETLWQKRITACYISGEADYGHFFEFYSSIRGAFQRKRDQLALDIFGKKSSELDRASKKEVYRKLPLVILVELDD